jgi:hypothetical protein
MFFIITLQYHVFWSFVSIFGNYSETVKLQQPKTPHSSEPGTKKTRGRPKKKSLGLLHEVKPKSIAKYLFIIDSTVLVIGMDNF